MTAFPTAYWSAWNADAWFLPGDTLPAEREGQRYAALAFVFCGTQFVLADITGRGLCIPSGRIEPGEAPEQAALREIGEETGAHVGDLRLIGSYRLVSRDQASPSANRWCPVYIANAISFEPLPPGSESCGIFLAELTDIPGLYFTWDPLMAAVFDYAAQCRH